MNMERQQNQWAKNCVTLIFSPYVKNNLMLICYPGRIRPAQCISQPHLFDCIAGSFQQMGIGNEYGQASGPGQGQVEAIPAVSILFLNPTLIMANS
jgi:hypothetical protein